MLAYRVGSESIKDGESCKHCHILARERAFRAQDHKRSTISTKDKFEYVWLQVDLMRLSERQKKKKKSRRGPGAESVPRMRYARCPITMEGKRVLQRSVNEGDG